MRPDSLGAERARWVLVFVLVLGIALGLDPRGSARASQVADTQVISSEVVIVRATTNDSGTEVYFDPIGVWIEPGTTIRWVLERSYHSVTAYHPANQNHELRIPQDAEPFDSGMMLEPGTSMFEITLTTPGVYDYFCLPHEHAGMVGRIVVGAPEGPGSHDFNYDPSQGWREVPKQAQEAFPSIDQIMTDKVVRHRSID